MKKQVWQAFGLLYHYPAFGRFWAGRQLSLFGDALTVIALPWFVLQVTRSGTASAGILLTLQLPAIITSLFIGSLLDRFQPRRIIAVDNVIRTVLFGVIPILYWAGALQMWLLFVLTFLAGMLLPATHIGTRSILPDLVADADLDAANMLLAFSVNLSAVIGPAVAGLLVAAFDGPPVLMIDAVTFGVMALVALELPSIGRGGVAVQAPLSERLGLHQLWRMKVVRLTTLLSLVFFLSYGPLEAALPLYSAAVLQTDAQGYGLLWAAVAAGSLIGTLGSAALSRRLRLGVVLPLIAFLWGASLLPMAFTRNLWLACGLLLLGGLVWGPYTPVETTLLQRSIPKDELGRVFGARSMLLTGGSPLGLALGGLLLAVVPSTGVIALSAVACIGVGLAGLASPTFRGISLPRIDSEC